MTAIAAPLTERPAWLALKNHWQQVHAVHLRTLFADDPGRGQRLALEAERPNLTLRILPLETQHTVFGESFVIFGFGEDSDAMLQDVVSTEHLKSGFILEGERETYLHRIAFQMLAEASLDPVESRALILETAESHWSGAKRHANA